MKTFIISGMGITNTDEITENVRRISPEFLSVNTSIAFDDIDDDGNGTIPALVVEVQLPTHAAFVSAEIRYIVDTITAPWGIRNLNLNLGRNYFSVGVTSDGFPRLRVVVDIEPHALLFTEKQLGITS